MKQFPYFAMKVAPEVDANGVSAAYLAANDDTLPADVPMFPPGASPGDGLFCMIDGADVPSMTRALTDDDQIINLIVVRYPGNALRVLAEGDHSITYRCEKADGTVIGIAMEKTILVLLVPPLDLVPPIVSDAPGGRLNPISALQGTTVHVRYGGMLAGQRVQVHWHGVSDAGSIDTAWQTIPAAVPDFVPFGIEPYLVAANVDATVDVSYTVDRDGDTADSTRLSLVVTAFNPQDMPMPQLPDLAGSDRIEPDKLPNGLRVNVPRWHLAFEGQQIWLWCDGLSSQQPGAYQHYMRTAHRVTSTEAAQGIFTTVPAAWLAPLAHGSRLLIEYQVGFHEGGRQSSRRLSFEVLNPSEEVVGDGVR